MTTIIESPSYQVEAEELAQTTAIRGMAYELILLDQNPHEISDIDASARHTAHKRGVVGSYIGASVRAVRIAYDSLLDENIPAAAGEFLAENRNAELAEAIYNNNALALDHLVTAPTHAWFSRPELDDEIVGIFANFGITVDAMVATEAVRRKAVARAAELGKTNG